MGPRCLAELSPVLCYAAIPPLPTATSIPPNQPLLSHEGTPLRREPHHYRPYQDHPRPPHCRASYRPRGGVTGGFAGNYRSFCFPGCDSGDTTETGRGFELVVRPPVTVATPSSPVLTEGAMARSPGVRGRWTTQEWAENGQWMLFEWPSQGPFVDASSTRPRPQNGIHSHTVTCLLSVHEGTF